MFDLTSFLENRYKDCSVYSVTYGSVFEDNYDIFYNIQLINQNNDYPSSYFIRIRKSSDFKAKKFSYAIGYETDRFKSECPRCCYIYAYANTETDLIDKLDTLHKKLVQKLDLETF